MFFLFFAHQQVGFGYAWTHAMQFFHTIQEGTYYFTFQVQLHRVKSTYFGKLQYKYQMYNGGKMRLKLDSK